MYRPYPFTTGSIFPAFLELITTKFGRSHTEGGHK